MWRAGYGGDRGVNTAPQVVRDVGYGFALLQPACRVHDVGSVKIVKDWYVTTKHLHTARGSLELPVHNIEVDHGARDARNRRIGGRITITDFGEEHGAERFDLQITGTRDGAAFGASRGSTYFADLAVAKAEAVARLERQSKGFLKTYGGRS